MVTISCCHHVYCICKICESERHYYQPVAVQNTTLNTCCIQGKHKVKYSIHVQWCGQHVFFIHPSASDVKLSDT